jgi:hypothetical protein
MSGAGFPRRYATTPFPPANRGLKSTATFRDRYAVGRSASKKVGCSANILADFFWMRVFRYFDTKGGIATLATGKMRWASPRAFNDPFELTPEVRLPRDDLIEQKLREDRWIREFHEKSGKPNGLSEEESKLAYFADELPKRLDKIKSSKERRVEEVRLGLLDEAAKHFRILCCSHTRDSILMWSHYAEKHRGLVIEIETDELELGVNLKPYIFDVRYRSSPPVINSLTSSMEEFEADFDKAFSTKALNWNYEEEVRIKCAAPDGTALDAPLDRKLPLSCIKRVIVGCYTHFVPGVMEEIERMANQSD